MFSSRIINLSAGTGPFEDQWRFFFRFFSKISTLTELQNQVLIENFQLIVTRQI